MKITVETGNWAARYVDESVLTLDMPEDTTVADVIDAIGIPAEETGIIVVDGKAVARDCVLSDGDVLKIYPVIIGG